MHLVVEEHTAHVESRNFPTNKGGLCQKGWTSATLLHHPDRLTSPLIRDSKGGPLRKASWDEALDRIADFIKQTQLAYGKASIGLFGGGGLTNEKAYMLGKFARVALQTSEIDYNGRFCMASAASASMKALGVDRGLPFPLADIPQAEAILLVGSNMAETMPPIMQYFQEQARLGGTLIVADPRLTPTAASARLHLQITPGTDAALANGLLHIAIRKHYIDEAFIAERTSGFEAVKRTVASYWPDRVERITGISEKQLELCADLLGQAKTAMILTARGPEQQSTGVNNVLAFINLALAMGKAGRRYCGYGCLTGQGNGQGGREHGQKSDQLPGYRSITNPEHRRHMAAIWNVPEASIPGPGKSAYEMLNRMGSEGGLKGLLVFGSNVIMSAPKAADIEAKLRKIDLLVVSDFFLSETAKVADVVLPSTQWAEEEGTMTNVEGRVLFRRAAMTAPAQVRSDLQILAGLAERLGYGSHFPSTPAAVFNELRRASAGGIADYAGITYERIQREDGIFWPCPSEDHGGTPRLFLERFGHEDGRAKFHRVEARDAAAESPDAEYPLFLTTGRVMAQYQSGTQTMRVDELRKVAPEVFVEIHPITAQSYGIGPQDKVRVTTRRGTLTAKASLTGAIRMDTIFIPFHFAGAGRANILTNPVLDPVSRMPEFKVCAVRIEKDSSC
jgi:assimilatory nitrate reductase catalytic subunit